MRNRADSLRGVLEANRFPVAVPLDIGDPYGLGIRLVFSQVPGGERVSTGLYRTDPK
jgi:hypothetical protein